MVKIFTWSYVESFKSHYAYYGKEELGYIEYWEPWKKWVWNQKKDIILSLSCMENVVKKLKELEEFAKTKKSEQEKEK